MLVPAPAGTNDSVAASVTSSGSRTTNRDPSPGRLSTQTLPPIRSQKRDDDGQPQPGAAVFAGRRHIGLRERVEDLLRLFQGHADTGIGDAELDGGGAVDRALADVDA